MSVFGIDNGIPNTTRTVIAGTSPVTVLDATSKSGLSVAGVLLVNVSGGSLTPVVDVYDGATAYRLRDDATLADQAREVVALPEFIRLKKGDVVRVTANTGLHVFVSYVEIPANKAQVI